MGWITQQGTDYCEGDKPYGNYWLETPTRPSAQHIWVNAAWQLDPTKLVPVFESAVQVHLDTKARLKNYDGILSACSYATSKSLTFGPEGIAFLNWRDAVWAYCYQALADAQAGKRAIPTTEQLLAELPVLVI